MAAQPRAVVTDKGKRDRSGNDLGGREPTVSADALNGGAQKGVAWRARARSLEGGPACGASPGRASGSAAHRQWVPASRRVARCAETICPNHMVL